MSRKTLISRIAAAGVAMLATLLLAPATGQALTIPPPETSAQGPLSITVDPDLSCQVSHDNDDGPDSFDDSNEDLPCGIYTTRGGTVYGPPDNDVDTLDYVGGFQFQGGLGTSESPYYIVTYGVCAGSESDCAEGLAPSLETTVSYVDGQESFRTEVTVYRNGGPAEPVGIYQYGDCAVRGQDEGFGFFDASTRGIYCSDLEDASPAEPGSIVGFVPVTPGSSWFEHEPGDVRARIDGSALPDDCLCSSGSEPHDNALALAWTGIDLPLNGSARRTFVTVVSPGGALIGDPPTVTLTSPADGSSTEDPDITFEGTADGDSPYVTVDVFEGETVTDDVYNSYQATVVDGEWTYEGAYLEPGSFYTARARQTDDSGTEGFSEPVTFFVVDTTTFTLTPQDDRNPVGDEHTVTATLETNRQGGRDDRRILFTVTGANPTPLDDEIWIETDEGGVATFTYTGENRGVDTITACADLDFGDSGGELGLGGLDIGVLGFGECDFDEPMATATKRWFDPEIPPPVTTIDSGPAESTHDQTPRFTFSSPDEAATFECSVDGGEFEPCTSPFVTDPLADGPHTFEVRATDIVGDTGPVSGRAFVVDTTPPATTLSGPTGLIDDATPTFTFTSNEPGTFECRIDDAEFSPCISGYSPALADGPHVVEVRAVDLAGNADPSAAQRAIVVDTTAPLTSITDGPTGTTGDPTPQFVFSSNEPGASFECRMDSGAFAPCASPFTAAPLTDGSHTFQVRATDPAGNIGPPASRTFVVDVAGPPTSITSGPTGSSPDATATFVFSSEPGSTFECRLDGGSFAPCTSPYTTGPLSEGPHTFEVRATDALGNTGPVASRSFTRDVTAPETQILFPDEGASRSQPVFVFFSDEPGATFECRVDGGAFEPCASPYLTDASLADGPHTFEVRATDAAGNVGPVSSRSFVRDTTPPDAAVTPGPSSGGQQSFEFTASEPGSTFECRVDGGSWEPCSSPFTTPALPPGPHTFEVRARDAAGNVSDPVSYSFTVAAPATPPPPPPPGGGTPPPPAGAGGTGGIGGGGVPAPGDRDGDGIPDASDTSDASVGPTLAQTVIARLISGEVFVRRPGSQTRSAVRAAQSGTPRGFVPLKGAEVLPVGTVVHSLRGRLALTSAASRLRGRTQTQRAEFFRGIFQIRQRRARLPTTDIHLRSANFVQECGSAARAGTAAGAKATGAFDVFAAQARRRSRKVVSRLLGNGKGRFRTIGRHSAATVRGTVWLTQERCDGTLTHVIRGVVSVRDNRARRTVTVRAGRSYIARAVRATVRTRRP